MKKLLVSIAALLMTTAVASAKTIEIKSSYFACKDVETLAKVANSQDEKFLEGVITAKSCIILNVGDKVDGVNLDPLYLIVVNKDGAKWYAPSFVLEDEPNEDI